VAVQTSAATWRQQSEVGRLINIAVLHSQPIFSSPQEHQAGAANAVDSYKRKSKASNSGSDEIVISESVAYVGTIT
jgi:hypothetical protein